MEQFKKQGITHILLNKSEFWLPDFRQHPDLWNVELVGQAGDEWLYEIK
jgi:hypothetical protein